MSLAIDMCASFFSDSVTEMDAGFYSCGAVSPSGSGMTRTEIALGAAGEKSKAKKSAAGIVSEANI